MGRACNMNGGEEKCIQDTGEKARRRETTTKTFMGNICERTAYR
jgi:hypothetical protein